MDQIPALRVRCPSLVQTRIVNLSTPPQAGAAFASRTASVQLVDSMGRRLTVLLLQPAMRIAHAQFSSQLSSGLQPIDAPRGHGRGPDPDRVLLFGSKELTSSGVVSHQLALAGRLADEVSQATRRGTDVDLSVPRHRRIRRASHSIRDNELQKYDAVVVALGESDAFALTRPQHWLSGMESLLEQIRAKSVPGTPIVVSGIPTIANAGGPTSKLIERARKHAERLNHVTERLCARWCNATFVPVPSSTGVGTRLTAAAYTERARQIARQLAPRLSARGLTSASGARTARGNRSLPQSLMGRRQALLDLGVSLAGSDEQLDRVVNLAKTYFRTQHAALVLSDGESMRIKSKSGFRGNPDLAKLASLTIETGRPVLIGNTIPASNDLFSFHLDGTEMGFYAGYPIEAPDGYRIGVLSVFDPEPRPARASDTVSLRDLAMLLQRELWANSGTKG